MKLLLIYGLSVVLCIGIFLDHVEAEEYGRVEHDDDDRVTYEKVSSQLGLLMSGTKNQILRLFHHFDKQRHSHHEIERKFQTFEEKLEQLQDRLLEQQNRHHNELQKMLGSLKGATCAHDQSEFLDTDEKTELLTEFQKVSKQQESILTKLDQSKCQTEEGPLAVPVNVDKEGAGEEPVHVAGVNVCSGFYTKILGELSNNLTNIDKKLVRINDQYTEGLLNKKEESRICDQKLVRTEEESHPTSCAVNGSSHCSNNKCLIKNVLYGPETFLVACDDSTDGGGWTVIQRRLNGSVNFYRGWSEYKNGFGDLDAEFWIGLDKLHALTTALAPVELLIQLRDHNDTLKYAKFGKFAIGNEEELYLLKEAGDYDGNAGDAFNDLKGCKFTTKDKDNDEWKYGNCAVEMEGAWWYPDCGYSNLNGMYYKNGTVPQVEIGSGIYWYDFHDMDYSLKFVQMLIRPKKS